MYTKLTLAKKWWQFYRTASNGVGHGIHSPFVFDFVKNVLNDKRWFYIFSPIEMIRKDLKGNHSLIHVDDLGAGSVVSKSNRRSVSEIARHALKPKKLAQLLFRTVNHYQPETILELGTSLGITTAYMAAANGNANVFTIEGSHSVAAIAKNNFRQLDIFNIHLIEGGFDSVLPQLLQKVKEVDFVFVDGNHRLEPTLRYFEMLLHHSNENTILVFDDIHWSEEMERAWKRIQQHDAVTCTIDLFFLGFVFLRKEFKVKQHFSIRY
jgi:predicted O-methyltransferase YrrM